MTGTPSPSFRPSLARIALGTVACAAVVLAGDTSSPRTLACAGGAR